jgi:valyl-tRNA synthetase
MKLKVTGTPDELRDKAESLVKSLGDILHPVSPDIAEALYKAIPAKEVELKFPVLRSLQEKTMAAYKKQMELMLEDIGAVLDKSLKTSTISKSEIAEEKSPDYTNEIVARDEKSYEQAKNEVKKYGYTDADFEIGGYLYGYSTNQLIDLAIEKKDA